jgi:hypothetical protein
MKRSPFALVVCLSLLHVAASVDCAHAAFKAYFVPAGTTGNTDYTGSVGMDFNVGASAITITRLGTFDSFIDQGAGGFGTNVIQVAIFNRVTQTIVPGSLTSFTGNSDPLEGSHRFRDIDDIVLPANFQGSIVAWSYNSTERLFDAGAGAPPAGWTTDTGGGLISFVGTGRTGAAGSFPTDVNASGAVNRYGAGTFEFEAVVTAVPEPTTLTMLGTAAIGAVVPLYRRWRAKVA